MSTHLGNATTAFSHQEMKVQPVQHSFLCLIFHFFYHRRDTYYQILPGTPGTSFKFQCLTSSFGIFTSRASRKFNLDLRGAWVKIQLNKVESNRSIIFLQGKILIISSKYNTSSYFVRTVLLLRSFFRVSLWRSREVFIDFYQDIQFYAWFTFCLSRHDIINNEKLPFKLWRRSKTRYLYL